MASGGPSSRACRAGLRTGNRATAYFKEIRVESDAEGDALQPQPGFWATFLTGPRLGALRPPVSLEARKLRRVGLIWSLLFLDVLGSGDSLIFPHRIQQGLTQGALLVAFVLALALNPKVRVRPSLFLGLYSVLAATSLMMSLRLVGIGTTWRGIRLVIFVAVLWLLTPWWGRRDLVLLRNQLRVIAVIIISVVLGFALSPGRAYSGGRLFGVIWPIPPTQVAHYAAELTGLTLLLWICGMIGRRPALTVAVPSFVVLLLTHTRTALVGGIAGFLVAGLSLFTARRRVRRAFGAIIVAGAVLALPLGPVVMPWLTRGENSTQLTNLTGRTNFWALVVAEQRPETNKILGNGLSNGSVDGLPIDSSWFEAYQDQGLVGDVLIALMFLLLLLIALLRPRGPNTSDSVVPDRVLHNRFLHRGRSRVGIAVRPRPNGGCLAVGTVPGKTAPAQPSWRGCLSAQVGSA